MRANLLRANLLRANLLRANLLRVNLAVVALAIVALGCNKPQATAPAPQPAAVAAAKAATGAKSAKSAPEAPKAVTGHPNLPGFIRPTAPVATVNSKPIPAAGFNKEFDRLVGSGVRIPADRIKHIARNILSRLIEDELRSQAIVRERIQLTEAEFDAAWQAHLSRYKDAEGALDKQQLQSHLRRNQITEDVLKQRIRRERLARKLVEKLGDVSVDRAEMKAFYDNNASAWIERESRDVRPILLQVRPDAPASKWLETQKKADEAYEALNKGGDFETIARRFGDVPRAPIHLTRASSEQKLAVAAFELGVGSIAKPIRTKWGFFVIRLLAKNDERHRPYIEVKSDIEERIRERKIYLEGQRLLREMRKSSDVVEKLPF